MYVLAVAFIGVVSNVHSLCATYSWLAWLCDLPPVIVGIISGILPPALLAILMMLLPIILRLLARFEGMPQRTLIELSLMQRYFIFQVIVCACFPPRDCELCCANNDVYAAFFPHCNPLFRYHRRSARPCEGSQFHPLATGAEPT